MFSFRKHASCMYPCPCGYAGDSIKECTCSNQIITRYQKRISGPMLDRIDIHIEVPRVEYEKLSDDRLGENSATIQARVEAARERQRVRFNESMGGISSNADMRPADLRLYCQLDAAGSALLKTAMQQLQLSARAYHRVLKLARTIADLAGEANIQTTNLAEALQYRMKFTGEKRCPIMVLQI
jgi:magnesium chelatase family protein